MIPLLQTNVLYPWQFSEILAFWDGRYGISQADAAGRASAWASTLRGSYTWVQATTTKQPGTDGTQVTFDGSAYAMSCASVDLSALNKMTVFAVMKSSQKAAYQAIFELTADPATAAGGLSLVVDQNTRKVSLANWESTVVNANETNGSFTDNTYFIVTSTADRTLGTGAQCLPWMGLTTASTVLASGNVTGNYANSTIYVGARGGTSIYLTGSLKALGFATIMSDARRTAFVNALSAEYGVST